ncbi:hypothetical protein TNCV_8291 [Trichonephila clavipes]|nr:hypothetical protein TNCV_8291 [Trichonephila clavipes]
MTQHHQDSSQSRRITTAPERGHPESSRQKIVDVTIPNTKWYPYAPGDLVWIYTQVHTVLNIPKCIKAEFIARWGCSQSSVVSSSQR